MNTVGAIAGIINTGLSIIDNYIEDPQKRLAARQEYIDSLKRQVEEILSEKDVEERNKLLLGFLSAIHSL